MKRLYITLLALGYLVGNTVLYAESIKVKGKISGAACAAEGMLCPSTPEHMENYEVMGVFTDNGKFFIPVNVPQKLLHANFLKEAVAEGKNLGNGLLKVSLFKIGGKTVFKDGFLIDPMGHRVKYKEAIFRAGKFLCPECAKME